MKITFRVLPLVLAASCIAPNTRLTVLDPLPLPPRPAEEILVLENEPDRAFHVVATWVGKEESPYGDQANVLRKKVVQRAAELGVDAVIVSVKVSSGMPVWIPGVASDDLEITGFEYVPRLEARLIVWRDQGLMPPP